MLVHSLACTGNEFVHGTSRRWVFTK